MRCLACLLLALGLLVQQILAQPAQYVEGWGYPLPSEYNYLTGNMGELRNNHFHAGLDIRAPIGTPVYASADGYVSRVRVSTTGYGWVIYLLHPQVQLMTVYAHLSDFSPSIKQYVRQQQYTQRSFEVECFPLPEQISVKKGDLIGYVGNTGFSFGPHLHYEIRTVNDHVLDPQRFFPWLMPDQLPPVITGIALNPLQAHSRVEQGIERRSFAVVSRGSGTYELARNVGAYGAVGVEIQAYDLISRAQHRYGIRQLRMYVDDQLVFAFRLEDFSLFENYSLNHHINYRAFRKNQGLYQRCYVLPGNGLSIYEGKGVIHIEEDRMYRVRVEVYDVKGNRSVLHMRLYGQKPHVAEPRPLPLLPTPKLRWEVYDDQPLRILVQGVEAPRFLHLYRNGLPFRVPLAAIGPQGAVYLWDLNDGIPEWVELEGERFYFPYQRLRGLQAHQLKLPPFRLMVAAHSSYADWMLKVEEYKTGHFAIGEPYQLLNHPIKVAYNVGRPLQPNEVLIVESGGGRRIIVPEVCGKDSLCFETNVLGEFRLYTDTQPPTVRLLRRHAHQLFFMISDDFSGIAGFEAYINGKFLLMLYESKQQRLYSDPDWQQPLRGKFELYVWDKAGNRKYVNIQL